MLRPILTSAVTATALLLATAAQAGVVTTTNLTGSTDIRGDRINFDNVTTIDEVTYRNEDPNQTAGSETRLSTANIGATLDIDDTGLINYINYAGAGGNGVSSVSQTRIRQVITNNTGSAVEVKVTPEIFGGGMALFQPQFFDLDCATGRLNQCTSTGDGSTAGFFAPGGAQAGVEFSVSSGGVSQFDFSGSLTLAGGGGGLSGDTTGLEANLNGAGAEFGYENGYVVYSWQDTLLDINLGVLAPGEMLEIDVFSSVFASSSATCSDFNRECTAAVSTFSDPLGSGGIGGSGGGGGFAFRSFSTAPRSLPPPQVFFRDADDPNGDFVLQNPIGNPGPIDVPAPGVLGLLGIGVVIVASRRRPSNLSDSS
ncbi:MAG: PEP-CTERM sorting domain-containing protein [Pacificimonas sp.]